MISGTKYSTGDTKAFTTGKPSPVIWRWVVVGLIIVLGSFLISRIMTITWKDVTELDKDVQQLVHSERTSGVDPAHQAQATLDSLKKVAQVSFVLLVALLIGMTILVYRILLAPLQLQINETQGRIERQEKLASLGILATGVAHEIRNPLTAIKFRLFSLKKSMPSNLVENEDLSVINSEINRLERIVKDFLQFARPSEPELAPILVDRLLSGIRELMQPQLEKESIQVKQECSDGLWVKADQQQIEQVLLNLVQNAADSIGSNGIITLRGRGGHAKLHERTTPAVFVEIVDTGKGIPPEASRRMFDPFFSTKEGGTGLGLPIAARIADKHGGFLHYESNPGRGATFRLVLPKLMKNESENTPG